MVTQALNQKPASDFIDQEFGLKFDVTRERAFLDQVLQDSARTPEARAYLTQRRVRKSTGGVTSGFDIPSQAVRSHHEQILMKAVEAQSTQPIAERDFGAITMAIDPERLPEAKKAIRAFRRKLAKRLETGNQTRVYCLSTQLFSLETEERKS